MFVFLIRIILAPPISYHLFYLSDPPILVQHSLHNNSLHNTDAVFASSRIKFIACQDVS